MMTSEHQREIRAQKRLGENSVRPECHAVFAQRGREELHVAGPANAPSVTHTSRTQTMSADHITAAEKAAQWQLKKHQLAEIFGCTSRMRREGVFSKKQATNLNEAHACDMIRTTVRVRSCLARYAAGGRKMDEGS
jgi:hypothetical protein